MRKYIEILNKNAIEDGGIQTLKDFRKMYSKQHKYLRRIPIYKTLKIPKRKDQVRIEAFNYLYTD